MHDLWLVYLVISGFIFFMAALSWGAAKADGEDEIEKWSARVALTAPLWPLWLLGLAVLLLKGLIRSTWGGGRNA